MGCIELKGPYDQLVEGLIHHVNQDCGRTFKAKCYQQGTREGSIFMYQYDTYPSGAIGRVSFIWDTCIKEKTRSLWIWTEPSFYKQLTDELQNTFNLKTDSSAVIEWDPPVLKKPKLVRSKKKLEKIATPIQAPNFSNGSITMTLLKNTLNRLRLTGPLSNSVLNRLLYPASLTDPSNYTEENWWSLQSKSIKNSVIVQKELWNSLSGADQPESYPPNCVIGFHTVDPRVVIPNKRTKALPSKGYYGSYNAVLCMF